MGASWFSSFWSLVSATPTAGQSLEKPLQAQAVPGLTTLLDVALYRAVEGQLTGTLCTAHALLLAWLDLKQQATTVLQLVKYEWQGPPGRKALVESFCRACFDAACDAVERMSTDRLAQSANLSDPFDSNHSHHHSSSGHSASTSTIGGGSGSGGGGNGGGSQHHQSTSTQVLLAGLKEASQDTTARRSIAPTLQRPKDCWESPRLHCPDYVWADDVAQYCQRLLRQLCKHAFVSDHVDTAVVDHASSRSAQQGLMSGTTERHAALLVPLVQMDLAGRLSQFRAAYEADSVVSKRLYLVKCEYRAPLRAFLEAHQSVQRAPSLGLVEDFLKMPETKLADRRIVAKDRLQQLLETPQLLEAMALERQCEHYEVEMARALHPFCEVARYLDHKRASIRHEVPGVLEFDMILEMQDLLHRLKGLLCRKTGSDVSSGIRPLLLDLQGFPRDEEGPYGQHGWLRRSRSQKPLSKEGALENVAVLMKQLPILAKLVVTRNAFVAEKKTDLDIPASILRGCSNFDAELWTCQFEDVCTMSLRQHALVEEKSFEHLSEQIRRAEVQMSLSVATPQSLEVVKQRLELISQDKEKRFEVLKETIEQVCQREMNLYVNLTAPDKNKVLALKNTSALGVFGLPLQMAGETLPIG